MARALRLDLLRLNKDTGRKVRQKFDISLVRKHAIKKIRGGKQQTIV